MKKLVTIILLLSITLALCGCEPDYAVDTFYATEMLNDYGLAGLPSPKLENSRLNGEYLYCNLTQEEYEAYVARVIAYLQGREDAHHLCYFHSGTMMFGFFPERIFAPVTEDYDLGGNHEFAYVTDETLSNVAALSPIRIKLVRESDTLGRTDFSYNTYICIDHDAVLGTVEPCIEEHHYDEGSSYPCPGRENITVYHCIYCELQSLSEELGYGYYDVNLTEGRNHILSNNLGGNVAWDITALSAGTVLEITVRRAVDDDTVMLVNGQSIPALREDANTLTFGFIMPEADVTIQIGPAAQMEETQPQE